MKIRLNPNRNVQGAFFLVVFVALIVLMVGGCVVYEVRKITKKWPENGGSPCTNATENLFAPTQPEEVVYKLLNRWIEVVNEEPLAQAVAPQTAARVIVISFLAEAPNVPVLSITNDANWVQADVSPYVDATGFPLLWSEIPNDAGQPVELYSSSDMTTWTLIATLRAATNRPALFRDLSPGNPVFYRARLL